MVDKLDRERQRLAKLYGEASEGELRKLAAEAAELTDVARQVLAEETAHRGLDISLADWVSADEFELREMATIGQFRDLPEALLAKGILDSAGIECFLVDQDMIRMNWFISNLLGGIKLQVNKEDAEEALALLSEPVPETFEVGGVGSYEQPQCPRCGSFDLAHQAGLDKRFALPGLWMGSIPIPVPRNDWKCQSCGQEWQDSQSDGPAADSSA